MTPVLNHDTKKEIQKWYISFLIFAQIVQQGIHRNNRKSPTISGCKVPPKGPS